MGSVFSKRMQGVATRLLNQFSSTVTLLRAGGRVWDENTGEFIRAADTKIPLTAVPVPIGGDLAGNRPAHFIDGTAIQAGDMKLICDSSVIPAMGDQVIFNGANWSVVAVSPPQVNDDVIVYFVLIRK